MTPAHPKKKNPNLKQNKNNYKQKNKQYKNSSSNNNNNNNNNNKTPQTQRTNERTNQPTNQPIRPKNKQRKKQETNKQSMPRLVSSQGIALSPEVCMTITSVRRSPKPSLHNRQLLTISSSRYLGMFAHDGGAGIARW